MSNTRDTKAQPDVGALNVEVTSKADTKVALDIDDAPFLMDDEELLAPTPSKALALKEPAEDPAVQAARKKKRIIIAAASLAALLVVVAVALWWFVFRTPPPTAPGIEPEVIVVPTLKEPVASQDFLVNFDPFLIEMPGAKGSIVFLVCKFTAICKTPVLAQEMRNKMLVLRDAVYFYLKNKPYTFLMEPANANTIKADLDSVLSGYLAGGKVDGMLFESYLSK